MKEAIIFTLYKIHKWIELVRTGISCQEGLLDGFLLRIEKIDILGDVHK